MKVLFLNTHSTLNPGDTGIVLAQVQLFRRLFPGVEISLTSRTPRIDREFYVRRGITVHPPFTPAPGVFSGVWGKCRGSIGNLIDLQGKLGLLAEIQDSDLVVSSGGGYFYSHGKHFPGPTFLQYAFHVKLARFWNKPVMLFPQSFGPLASRAAARVLKSVLEDGNVVKIFAREEISRDALAALLDEDGGEKVSVCPDVAFCLEPKINRGKDDFIASLRRPVLALTLRDWGFPGSGGQADQLRRRRKYLEALLGVTAAFLRRFRGSVIVVPQVRGPDLREDDISISREFFRMCGKETGRNDIFLIPLVAPASPDEIVSLLSRVDLVVATRFHSAIFAMLAGTPVIIIGYQHKAAGTLRMLGLERLLQDISAISPTAITALVEEILDNYPRYRKKTEAAVSRAREMIVARLERSLARFVHQSG